MGEYHDGQTEQLARTFEGLEFFVDFACSGLADGASTRGVTRTEVPSGSLSSEMTQARDLSRFASFEGCGGV